MKPAFRALFSILAFAVALRTSPALSAAPDATGRPVLWYCLHYQAPGENRYAPDGNYRIILGELGKHFDVRVSDQRPSSASLKGVDVVLIANPNDKAFQTNRPPHHVDTKDIEVLDRYVRRGGGLIVLGNQENHNLETQDLNRLLARFGMAFRDDCTDIKKLQFAPGTPAVAGLWWAYYIGNRIEFTPPLSSQDPLRRRAWMMNRAAEPALKGSRSAEGCLLASAEPGKGRVLLVTDGGWIANVALNGTGVNGVYILQNDNIEIMTRMTRWAAGR